MLWLALRIFILWPLYLAAALVIVGICLVAFAAAFLHDIADHPF